MSKNFKAIMLALIASFCAVLMSVFLKLAQEDSNVFTVGFLRFFFGLLLITPTLLFNQTLKFIIQLISNYIFYDVLLMFQ